jgi:hypothetical protein
MSDERMKTIRYLAETLNIWHESMRLMRDALEEIAGLSPQYSHQFRGKPPKCADIARDALATLDREGADNG